MKAMETSSIHLEKEMEVQADRSARKKIEMKAEMHRGDPVHLEEVCCCEEEMEREKHIFYKKKPGKGPENLKRT